MAKPTQPDRRQALTLLPGLPLLALPLLALPLLSLPLTSPVRAQTPYPNRPIKLIVPYPAGGQTDAIARLLAQKAEGLLGQPMVIDNRTGASSVIGTDFVAKSAPDGHTLLFNQTALVTNAVLLSKIPYDPFRDFLPVFRAYELAAVWAVPPNRAKTLAEFLQQAKAASAPLTFGTSGHGTASHFYGETLARAAGVTFAHVGYKGELPILPDLIAGRLDAGVISTASALQYGTDGRVRTLAVSGQRRMTALPNLATFQEQGIAGISPESFAGVFAPADTPVAVVDRLHEVFSRVCELADVRERFLLNGLEVAASMSPQQFGVLLRRSYDQWTETKRNSGIRLD